MKKILSFCLGIMLLLLCLPVGKALAAQPPIRPYAYWCEANQLYLMVVNDHNDNSGNYRPIMFHKKPTDDARWPQEVIIGSINKEENSNTIDRMFYCQGGSVFGKMEDPYQSYYMARVEYNNQADLVVSGPLYSDMPKDPQLPWSIEGTYKMVDVVYEADANMARYFLAMLPWEATGINAYESNHEYIVEMYGDVEEGATAEKGMVNRYGNDFFCIKVNKIDMADGVVHSRQELGYFYVSNKLNLVYLEKPNGEIYCIYDQEAVG